MKTPISIEAVSYTTNKEKRAAVRLFRNEFPDSKINVLDGVVTCERRLNIDQSVFAYLI
jgi:hypothetical protein